MMYRKIFYIGFCLLVMLSPSYADENGVCNLLDKSCTVPVLGDKNTQGQSMPKAEEDTTRAHVRLTESQGLAHLPFSFVKGSDHAAISIIVYWDFLCPSCKEGLEAVNKVMALYPDEVRVVYKLFSSSRNTFVILAHEAALAANDQGKFWEMHDILLSHEGEVTKEILLKFAKQLGINNGLFKKALQNHTFRGFILDEIMEAKGFGVTSAPTYFINGRKLQGVLKVNDLRRVVNAELGLSPRVPSSPRQPASFFQTSLVNIAVGEASVKGPKDASIVIVEYSDFQCPFCARSVSTVEGILEKYPDKVRWVFKHFPLDFHQDAYLAHKAAFSAREQGRFWEMHDLIFLRQNAIKREDLIQYAIEIDLDMDRFIRDMDSEKYNNEIDRDIEEGRRIGVRGTPTFFVNGHRLVGAQSMGRFIAVIEKILKNPEIRLQSKGTPPEMNHVPPSDLSKMGSDLAPVLIEAFIDLLSPLAAPTISLLKTIKAQHESGVRIVIRHLPQMVHPDATIIHQAALAAGDQGKYWEMQDLILDQRENLDRERLLVFAEQIGLDTKVFLKALDTQVFKKILDQDRAVGLQRNIKGVPTLFINNKKMEGVPNVSVLSDWIGEALGRVEPGVPKG